MNVCHQLCKNKSKKGRSSGTIVKFVRRFDKQQLLELNKFNKPKLSTRHINMASDSPINVKDSLCLTQWEVEHILNGQTSFFNVLLNLCLNITQFKLETIIIHTFTPTYPLELCCIEKICKKHRESEF